MTKKLITAADLREALTAIVDKLPTGKVALRNHLAKLLPPEASFSSDFDPSEFAVDGTAINHHELRQ